MKSNCNLVGIDIAKKDFYACFEEQNKAVKFNNDSAGIHTFIRELNKYRYNKNNTVIGLESTASYHFPLCFKCTALGYVVKVINPLAVKKQNQTSLRRLKTDQKDAALIRYCVGQGMGYEFNETAESLKTKSLVRQRNSLANWILKLKRQLNDIEYKQACLGECLPECYSEIKVYLEKKSKGLEKNLKKQEPELQKLLRTIPGVGPLTAVAFISEVGDIQRFSSAKQLCAYAGIDPRVHESGTSVRGKGYISKRGSKILRTRLYNACSVAVLRPNMFQVFFQKKISEGKPYRVALVATMNKMVHVIYSVWTNNKPFEDYVFKPKEA
jgi:transposase